MNDRSQCVYGYVCLCYFDVACNPLDLNDQFKISYHNIFNSFSMLCMNGLFCKL